MSLKKLNQSLKGGPGSGHRGHAGRKGKRGGSAPGKGGGGSVVHSMPTEPGTYKTPMRLVAEISTGDGGFVDRRKADVRKANVMVPV